jgi:hypothetical protein
MNLTSGIFLPIPAWKGTAIGRSAEALSEYGVLSNNVT